MRKLIWWMLLASAMAAAACHPATHDAAGAPPSDDDDDASPAVGLAAANDDRDHCRSGHKFAFELTDGRRNIPFPTDLYAVADAHTHTGRLVQLPENVATYLDHFFSVAPFIKKAINTLDGFSVTGAALFSVDAPPYPASLPDNSHLGADDSVFLVEVDPDAATPAFWPVVFQWEYQFNLFKVRPYLPLLQNRTYAVVITDKLRAHDGSCYETADEFRYVRSRAADLDSPQAAPLEPARQQLAPMFDFLENRLGVERGRIIAATFFSTQDLTTDIFQMKETLAQRAAQNPPTIESINYVGATSRLDSIWDLEYDTVNWRARGLYGPINCDADRRPQPTGVEKVMARLTLPSPTQHPQPWPVVVFMHGIGASRVDSTPLCETLADYGFACIGIDDVFHGFRAPYFSNVATDLFFFDPLEPLAWRANWLQDVADQMWLLELIKTLGNLDLSPHATGGDGIADLDVNNVMFLGHSLGAMHGGILAAVEDRYGAFALNAGASDYRAIALASPNGAEVFDVLHAIQQALHFNIYAWGELLLDMLVLPVEGGDPFAYSPYVFRRRLPEVSSAAPQIFQQVAAYDATMGPLACGRMATSLGLTQLQPVVWQIPDVADAVPPYQGDAVYQWNTEIHAFAYEYESARQQLGAYFRSWVDSGAGIINREPAP